VVAPDIDLSHLKCNCTSFNIPTVVHQKKPLELNIPDPHKCALVAAAVIVQYARFCLTGLSVRDVLLTNCKLGFDR